MSKDLTREHREVLAPTTPITASPASHRIQEIGQRFLGMSQFQQVSETVFTTCPDPIESAGYRLIRARDSGIPLVEVKLLREDFATDEIRELFEIETGPLVHQILRSDGQQQFDSFWGNHIRYEEIGLSHSKDGLVDGSKSRVSSVLSSGMYVNYDDSGGPGLPGFSSNYKHEDTETYWLKAHPQDLEHVLDEVILDAERALRREGAIDSTAIEIVEVPVERQIGREAFLLPPAGDC